MVERGPPPLSHSPNLRNSELLSSSPPLPSRFSAPRVRFNFKLPTPARISFRRYLGKKRFLETELSCSSYGGEMSTSDFRTVADASLHPPIHGVEAPDAPAPASVLLDYRAYIDGRRNATTAWSKTRGGHSISVTFWAAHPPRVSCFSVYCPDLTPGDFAQEPVILATEDDVVVLCVVLGTVSSRHSFDYFVYQAGGGAGTGAPPSLELLKHPGPSREFSLSSVGLLRCRRTPKLELELDDSQPTLRSHHGSRDGGFYIIAALCYASPMVPGHYDLYTYDSRTKEWATRTALLRQEQELGHHSSHCSTKVIVVGGKTGTMGWIDLRHGILFCDVLLPEADHHTLPLTYIASPPPLKPDRKTPPDRDIAVIKGRIKYVEFITHVRPGSVKNGDFIADDWTAVTWSRKATSAKSLENSSWQRGSMVRASEITAARQNSAQFELLPKLLDDEGTPQPTLQRLHTSHPTLSLLEDNVVYFMTKVNYRTDTKAWVIAVNSKTKSLQGVAEFDALRNIGMIFTYMCSKISQHLNMAPAIHGHHKRAGKMMRGPPHKKHAGIPRMDLLVWDGERNQDSKVEGISVRDLDQDNMDLD